MSLGDDGGSLGIGSFVSVARTADVLDILDSNIDPSERLHVFAPTDEALSLYLDEFPDLESDEQKALALLSYHIVPSDSCDVLSGNGLTTLLEEDGQTLDVSSSTVVDPNGYKATILSTYPMENGYLYIIDSVLTPLLGDSA